MRMTDRTIHTMNTRIHIDDSFSRSVTHHSKQLTRAVDSPIAGVCEGLGRYYDLNPTALRLGWLVAILFFGTGIMLYLALWWVVPREDELPCEPTIWERDESGNRRPPLRRTTVDRRFLGVCGGLARRWGVDPSFVRLAAISLAILSFGAAAAGYLLLAVLMPSPHESLRSPARHPVDL